MAAAALWLCGASFQAGPESRLDDSEFARSYAKVVKAYEMVEKTWSKNPAASLAALEKEVLSSLPKTFETTIVVRYTQGINKGDEKERHDFYPYRLAGECALAAGLPERAVAYLEKSPASAGLLAEAKKAAADRAKRPEPVLQKPAAPNLAPFLEKRDFAGALEVLKPERARLGKEYDVLLAQVRNESDRHQREATTNVARVLPLLEEPTFREDQVEPCLKSCVRVPAEWEIPELRWVRRLGEWTKTRDPAGLDRLGLEAAALGPAFHAACERAQAARLREIKRLVEVVIQAPRAERTRLLGQLDDAERAFRELSRAKEFRALLDDLGQAKARLPVDDDVVDEARAGATTIRGIRILAQKLEGVWKSPRRTKLSVPDQADLALYFGLYRCLALFLEGKTIEEAAADPLIAEAFRAAPPLPKDASPKVAAARALIK